MSNAPERWTLPDGRSASRLICGLWQVADLEKNGTTLDPEKGADNLAAYVSDGIDTFDMADHYGSAELITGRLMSRFSAPADRPLALTKWCPPPGPMTADIVRRGVVERLRRLGVESAQLTATTRGEIDATGADETGWREDRRVDLELVQ